MGASRAFRFAGGIDPEDDVGGFFPSGLVLGGVEQPQIDGDVLAIIFGNMWLGWSYIFDWKGVRRAHERSILGRRAALRDSLADKPAESSSETRKSGRYIL